MKQKARSKLAARIAFPEDELRLPWLPMLLDAYAIVDTGVAIAIRNAQKQAKKLACSQGCDVCCHQPDIPVYPHELVGLYWYAKEKLDASAQAAVKKLLAIHRKGDACPFLADHACVVHPVRPLACRQYNVFTVPCAPGEDPYFSRREDVLVPIDDYTTRAFKAVLAFYRMDQEKDVEQAVRVVRRQIMNLQEYDWRKLVAVMEGKE